MLYTKDTLLILYYFIIMLKSLSNNDVIINLHIVKNKYARINEMLFSVNATYKNDVSSFHESNLSLSKHTCFK